MLVSVLEAYKHEHGQAEGNQAQQVAQAVDVGGQLHGGIKVGRAHIFPCYVTAVFIIGVVVPFPVQVAISSGVVYKESRY